MASQNPFLANWVRAAYGMELGLVPMLDEQAARLDDDTELHKSLMMHLEKTRRHASLLRERLERMGEDISTIRPIDPVTATIGHPNGGKPDPARQIELLDYVTESFEVASYRALQSLAEMLGDRETGRVCEQILADELVISDALSRRLPGHNGHNGNKDTRSAAVQGMAGLAREVFAALNGHDLDLFDKLVAKDHRTELPGDAHAVDPAQNRAHLQGFFRAFPDLRYQLNRVASSGDSAFVEWTATGTHSGPLAMTDGPTVKATNKKVKFDGVTILRFRNDKLIHTRILSDNVSFMRQLGVMPGSQSEVSKSETAGREIVHLEIPAIDRSLTARFYGALFGWEYQHMDAPANYTTFRSGTIGGGFPDVNEINPAGEVIFYVDSEDIEADLRRAESLGGKTIVPRTEIPGYGYFAILSDPGGNRVGLYKVERPE